MQLIIPTGRGIERLLDTAGCVDVEAVLPMRRLPPGRTHPINTLASDLPTDQVFSVGRQRINMLVWLTWFTDFEAPIDDEGSSMGR